MTQENQQRVEPALPPGVLLHLEQRGRVLRQMEITDDLVEQTLDRALEVSRPARGGSRARWLLSPAIVGGFVICFFGGMKWAHHNTPYETPLAYHVQMKKYSGDPAIYFDKDLTAWTQYNQCKASKLDLACSIGLRHAMVVIDASSCKNDKLCNFYVAGRLGDSLGEWATAKALDVNNDIENLPPKWGPDPSWTGSGSGTPQGVAANGSAAAAGSAVAGGSGDDRMSADHAHPFDKSDIHNAKYFKAVRDKNDMSNPKENHAAPPDDFMAHQPRF